MNLVLRSENRQLIFPAGATSSIIQADTRRIVLQSDLDKLILGAPIQTQAGHLPWLEDEFTPTLGQVTFVATQLAADTVSKEFYLNGVLQDDGLNYSVSGATFTWIGSDSLDSEDKVIIRYQ